MKKTRTLKQVIGVVLTLAILIGLCNLTTGHAVQASETMETCEVTLQGQTSNNAGTILLLKADSLMPAADPVYYMADAYINGSTTTEKIRMMSSSYWKGFLVYNGYCTTTLNTATSISILAGTTFTQCDASGTEIENGNTYSLSKALKLTKIDDTWFQMDEPEEFTLTLNQITDANVVVMQPSNLPDYYAGFYRFSSYANGVTTAGTSQCTFFTGEKEYWKGNMLIFAKQMDLNNPSTVATTSFYIPAGTLFQEYTSDGKVVANGKQLKLAEDFLIVKQDGTWKQVATPAEFTLTLNQITDANVVVMQPSNLPDYYAGFYRFSSYANGVTTAGTSQCTFFTGEKEYWKGNMLIFAKQMDLNNPSTVATTSFYIPAGTLFQECDSAANVVTNGRQLKLAEDFLIVKQDGTWRQVATPAEFTLTYNSFDGNVGTFKPSTLPDYYTNKYYCFESYLDGSTTEKKTIIQFMPTTNATWKDHMLIWGNQWPGAATTATSSFYIPAGTILKEYVTGKDEHFVENGRQLKLTEAVCIEKDGTTWKTVEAPEKDVSVKINGAVLPVVENGKTTQTIGYQCQVTGVQADISEIGILVTARQYLTNGKVSESDLRVDIAADKANYIKTASITDGETISSIVNNNGGTFYANVGSIAEGNYGSRYVVRVYVKDSAGFVHYSDLEESSVISVAKKYLTYCYDKKMTGIADVLKGIGANGKMYYDEAYHPGYLRSVNGEIKADKGVSLLQWLNSNKSNIENLVNNVSGAQ